MTETLIVTMTMTPPSHQDSLFLSWTLKCVSPSMLVKRFGLFLFSPETSLHPIRPMWHGVFLQLVMQYFCGTHHISCVCWWSANSIVMIKLKKKLNQPLSILAANKLCVSCPRRELCCSLWRLSAAQLWKCVFIQDALARAAGCSLTAFWQSNITSSWAPDNHPLSRTLSYLSTLEALLCSLIMHMQFCFFFFPVGWLPPPMFYVFIIFMQNLKWLILSLQGFWRQVGLFGVVLLFCLILIGKAWTPFAGRRLGVMILKLCPL